MIVPFPPGGGTDTVARPLAAKLSQLLGQQFVIENRGGAGGTIGAAMAAKSPADGYTVLLYSVHGAVAASAYKNLAYDIERDLVPVTTAAIFPDVLVAANKRAGEDAGGAGRLRQGESRQDQLRLRRQRHVAPPFVRDVPHPGRHRGDARAVQGHRSRDHGAARGRDRLHLRGARQRLVAHPRRHHPADRGHLGEAFALVSRHPDRDRVRDAGFRGHLLVRPVVPGGNAARDRRQAARGGGQGVRGAGHEGHVVQARRRARRRDAEEFRDLVSRDVAKWGKVVREAKISVD